MSGQPFDEFLESRIFQPLRMRDTAFWVPAEKKSRLTAIYTRGDDGKLRPYANPPRDYLSKPKLASGGGGLASTTRDYLRFVQMLLDGGELGGRRLLSRKTVELMASDAIGDQPRARESGPGRRLRPHLPRQRESGSQRRARLGRRVQLGRRGRDAVLDRPQGRHGTFFMIQILPHEGLTYGSEFKTLAYQSIVD